MKTISRYIIVLAFCLFTLSSNAQPGYYYNNYYNPYTYYNPYYTPYYSSYITLPWVSQIIFAQLALAQRQYCANQYYSCVVSTYSLSPYIVFQPLPAGAICTNQYFYCTGYW